MIRLQRFFLAGIVFLLFFRFGTGICKAEQTSQKSEISTVSISPDGLRLAIVEKKGETIRIIVSATPQMNGKEATSFNGGLIGGLKWSYDGKYLLFDYDRTMSGNSHIFCTNLHSGGTRDLTPDVTTSTALLSLSPAVPNESLILIQKKDSTCRDVYRIDLKSGKCSIDCKNDGKVTMWLSDRMLKVRGAIKQDGKGYCTLEVRDTPESAWHQLMKWKRQDNAVESAAFSHDGKKLFIVAPNAKGSQSVLLLDPATKKKIELFDGKGDTINGIAITTDGNAIEAVSLLKRAHTFWKSVDSSMAPRYEKLHRLYRADNFQIQNRSIDNSIWIVEYMHEDGKHRIYLYNFSIGKATLLVDSES
ncbi:MAG: WD40 repeat domain-containing protein [Candidatus Xenobiia bacterium LiM19]